MLALFKILNLITSAKSIFLHEITRSQAQGLGEVEVGAGGAAILLHFT